MINLVGVFWGPDDQKCFLRVLLGYVVWGSEKLFLGVLTKDSNKDSKLKIQTKILKKDSNYLNMIHRNKSLNKLFFMGVTRSHKS